MSRSRMVLQSALSLAVVAALLGSAQAQSVTLRFAPASGKTFNYVLTTESKSSAGGPALGMSMNMETAVSVLAKSAKGTNMRMKVTRVKMTGPQSGPAATSQISQMEKQLTGSTVDQVYDSRARSVGAPTSSSPQLSQVMSQMGALSAGFMGVQFPAQAVGVGSKWNAHLDFKDVLGSAMPGMSAGKNSKVPVTFTLKKIEKKGTQSLATIATTMKGTLDMSMGGGSPSGQTMQMSMLMDMKGTIVVDTATGIPVSGTTKGTIGVKLGAQGAINQTVTSTVKLKG